MPERLAYHLYHLFWVSLDWLYPPTCGGCDQRGARWCDSCQQSVEKIQPPLCPSCGQSQSDNNICIRCSETPPRYDALRSLAVFSGKIRNALHRLKYQRDISLGDALARPLIAYLTDLNWSLDIVIAVPLGPTRMSERGYNQAALLAKPLSLATGLPFSSRALQRVRETSSQVGLSAISRRKNVAGAFRANRKIVAEKNILVIDDVTTSGATLDSCAVALLTAGAKSVYGLTLARAVLSSKDDLSI